MARRTFKRSEAVNFLKSYKGQVAELAEMARRAETEATKENYELYYKFRAKVSECETFSIMIDQRLHNLAEGADEKLNRNFMRLNAHMLGCQIRASIRFFFVLSMSNALPMGAREMFMEELKRMHSCHAKLNEPRYADVIDQDMKNNLDIATDIIEEIIERAPNMFSFTAV